MTMSESAVPHDPAASRPRTQSGLVPPGKVAALIVALTATVGVVKVPVMAVPLPAAAGAGPTDHSAWVTLEFPVWESSTVAFRTKLPGATAGFGLITMLPATTTGP